MNITDKLSSIWPQWRILELIGEEPFGKVYKAACGEALSEIRVITVPGKDSDIAELCEKGMAIEDVKSCFGDIVTGFTNELSVVSALRGTANVVAVDDFKPVIHEDGIGYDIFIRSELLKPISAVAQTNEFTDSELAKLGADLCSAIDLYRQAGVVCGEIDSSSIYLSEKGSYKLKDTGISKYFKDNSAEGEDIASVGKLLYRQLKNNSDTALRNILFSMATSKSLLNPGELRNELLRINRDILADNVPTIDGEEEKEPEEELQYRTSAKSQKQEKTKSGKKIKNKKKPLDSKEKKKLIIIISVCVGVLLIGGIIAVVSVFSAINGGGKEIETTETAEGPFRGVLDALDDKKFDYAIELFLELEDIDNGLIKGLNSRLEQAYNEYLNNSVTYDEAIGLVNAVKSMNISEVSTRLEKAEKQIEALKEIRDTIEEAEALETKGEYADAIALYETVDDDYVDYSSVESAITKLKKSYKKVTLSEAAEYADEEDYDKAVSVLEAALYVLGSDSDISSNIEKYKLSMLDAKVDAVLEKAAEYVEDNDYVSAITYLQGLDNDIASDSKVEKNLDRYLSDYESYAVSQANKYISNGNYDSAAKIISEALTFLPDSTKLSALYDKLSVEDTTGLANLSVLSADGYSYNNGNFTDADGYSYSGYHHFDAKNNTASVKYSLGGSYTAFTGYWTACSDTGEDCTFEMKIYVDGVAKDYIYGYDKSTGKVKITLDIKGAETIEFTVTSDGGSDSHISLVAAEVSR